MLKRMRSSGLALIVLGLGLGFADSSSALEIGCSGSGCVGGGLDFDLHVAPNVQLAGTLSLQSRHPFGFGATVLGDLVRPMANQNACHASNGRSLCLLQALSRTSIAHRGVYPLRIRVGPDRIQTSPNVNAIPEPSAALIFGVGMLIASGLVMRTGEIE